MSEEIGGQAGASVPLTLIDAAGDLIVGSANDTAARLGKGSALQVLRVNAAGAALEWATPAAGLLSVIQYGPSSPGSATSTSATPADIHATALTAPDFVIPASGRYLVVFSAQMTSTNNSTVLAISLADGGGDIAKTSETIAQANSGDANRCEYRRLCTGTPGATVTGLRPRLARVSGASTVTIYFDDGDVGANESGPALFEVWAA